MFILFSLIVMRMSGALAFNSLWSRSNYPPLARGMLIFMLSSMTYVWIGGVLLYEPTTMLEYGLMLVKEMAVGACLGFGMELSFMAVRFATSMMDFTMGLNMAQVYDPSTSSQSTVTSSLYNIYLMLIFFSTDGHLRFFRILFSTLEAIPFGGVVIDQELTWFFLKTFNQNIILGLQLAFPIIGIELLMEVALGILMRIIPQINIFSINFQMKIIVGMVMLFLLFNPMMDALKECIRNCWIILQEIIPLLSRLQL